MSDTIRTAAALTFAVDLLARDDNWRRALAIHRADYSRCISCGSPFPCSTASLALAAEARLREQADNAVRKAAEVRTRRSRWRRRPSTVQGDSAPGGAA